MGNHRLLVDVGHSWCRGDLELVPASRLVSLCAYVVNLSHTNPYHPVVLWHRCSSSSSWPLIVLGSCSSRYARYAVAVACRYVIQSLPLMLLGGVALALVGTKALQTLQSKVLHVVPFGLLTKFNIVDACVGILVSGSFILFFGTASWRCLVQPSRAVACSLLLLLRNAAVASCCCFLLSLLSYFSVS